GLSRDDAAFLVAAKAIAANKGYTPEANHPPLFVAFLAFFTLISQKAQWLKLLPLGCAAGWLLLTRKLLLKMGAARNDTLLIVGLTAASPMIVFLSTSLFSETLFALLVTGSILALLDERALTAGLLAALATLAGNGLPLIVASMITLAARGRFR